MRDIRKEIVRDGGERPIAVQIDYQDWLQIERSLKLENISEAGERDLSRHEGVIALGEEPLASSVASAKSGLESGFGVAAPNRYWAASYRRIITEWK